MSDRTETAVLAVLSRSLCRGVVCGAESRYNMAADAPARDRGGVVGGSSPKPKYDGRCATCGAR